MAPDTPKPRTKRQKPTVTENVNNDAGVLLNNLEKIQSILEQANGLSEPQTLNKSERSQTLLEHINDLTTKLATLSAQHQKELNELRTERDDLCRQLLDERATSQQKATEKESESWLQVESLDAQLVKEIVGKLEREKSALVEELKMERQKSTLLKEAVSKLLYEQHSNIFKFLNDVEESDDLPLEQRNRRVEELAWRFTAGPTAPPDNPNAAAQQDKELERLSHPSREILGDINYDTGEEHDIEEDGFRKTPLRVGKRKRNSTILPQEKNIHESQ